MNEISVRIITFFFVLCFIYLVHFHTPNPSVLQTATLLTLACLTFGSIFAFFANPGIPTESETDRTDKKSPKAEAVSSVLFMACLFGFLAVLVAFARNIYF